MKRFVKSSAVGIVAILAIVGVYALASVARAQSAGLNGPEYGPHMGAAPAVTLANRNRGIMNFSAAINTDGSIAACFECDAGATGRLGTGQYQVGFIRNVQANFGWFRTLQVDTLTSGAITGGVSCTTADRAGNANAVFVYCTSAATGGATVDTSFSLQLSR